ncbi:MAG: toll/interleukin-1 receptor domain-containing protein [Ktedonobacteraceae bacterium]
MAAEPVGAIKIFYCYARKDEKLRDELEKHLGPLKRSGWIITWHDHEIQPGAERESEIDARLRKADIILLLVSPDFIHSDYCDAQMHRALERHKAGEVRVIPVILRPVDWKATPLSELQVLPEYANPITRWSDRDEAFESVVMGIREIVETLLKARRKIWSLESDCLYLQGRYDEAVAIYEHLIRLDPSDVKVYCTKGNALMNLKRYDEALIAYKEALRFDPNNPIANCRIGLVHLLQGRSRESQHAYEKVQGLSSFRWAS